MRTYSLDLRKRVVGAVDRGGLSQERVAQVFDVSVSWIKKLLLQRRTLGHIEPLAHGGGNAPLLDEKKLAVLRREVARKPDTTLKELCRKVPGAKGKRVSVPTMSRAVAGLGLTRKKEGAFGQRTGPRGARRPLGVDGGVAQRRSPARLS